MGLMHHIVESFFWLSMTITCSINMPVCLLLHDSSIIKTDNHDKQDKHIRYDKKMIFTQSDSTSEHHPFKF